jgi:regulator of replication initiation timing
MNKPLVFNYKEHEELKQAYKELLDDNNKLVADNRRLRDQIANLEIKLRILVEDMKGEK